MSRKLIALTLAGAALAAVGAIGRKPVLCSLSEPGDLGGVPQLVLFNPFRDRSPEIAGGEALRQVQAGALESALAAAPLSSEVKSQMSVREAEYRLLSWKLVNRTEESDDRVRLAYRVDRLGAGGRPGPLWLTLQRAADRQWAPVDLETWY